MSTRVVTLDIESIASGGDGVARTEGLVVFVPRTAPGDRVVARISTKGRLARGVVERIEQPAATRVVPECVHYDRDRCGGCQLQHLTLDAQHEAKRTIIRDSIRRIGKRDVELPPLHAGANAWRYRRKLTLALRRDGQRWYAGLHAFDNPEQVFSLEDCNIADERLLSVWREILAASVHLPDVPRLRGSVRLLGDRAVFVLEGGWEWSAHEEFFAAAPGLSALWWVNNAGTRVLLADRREHAEPGASFAQVNPEVAAQLEAFVIDRVMSHTPQTVVDGYAGSGDVALALAARGVCVTAIELDAEASAWSASRLMAGSRAITARVEDALGAALPADVVLLNPPRAGLDARVTSLLSAATPPPRAIVYVSCDPATLARDLLRLAPYRIASLTAFDMFPQTAHVETVCELVPLSSGVSP